MIYVCILFFKFGTSHISHTFFGKHLTTITLINIQLRSTPNPVIVTTRILTIFLKGHPELNMFFAPGILGWGGYRVAAIDAANAENRRCRGLVFGALLGPETCQVVSGAQKIHKMMWQGFRLSNHPKVYMKVWMMYMFKWYVYIWYEFTCHRWEVRDDIHQKPEMVITDLCVHVSVSLTWNLLIFTLLWSFVFHVQV